MVCDFVFGEFVNLRIGSICKFNQFWCVFISLNHSVEDLKWAINTGVSTNAEWYPDFETVTGRKLTDELTMDDMALYFHCKGTNTDNCGGITAPCGRACPSDVGSCGNIPSTWYGVLSLVVSSYGIMTCSRSLEMQLNRLMFFLCFHLQLLSSWHPDTAHLI